ncbi:MAG: signal peptidase I [Armatimonadetes bacterium]|nr:signal peptidase I [Armatimonadota bacterium]
MTPEGSATEWLANLSIGYVVIIAAGLTIARLLLYQNQDHLSQSISELLALIIAGMLVFLIIRPFFVQAFYIPSASMENTLEGHNAGYSDNRYYAHTIHDHIFVNKLAYRFGPPKRGDIIVFRAPKSADLGGGFKHENILIKRVIAVPGDTILITNGHVYVNGKALVEPYILGPMDTNLSDTKYAQNNPYHLGPNEFFVMGDNRNDSNDSRFWGPVSRDRIIGKAEFIFWPLSRIRDLY